MNLLMKINENIIWYTELIKSSWMIKISHNLCYLKKINDKDILKDSSSIKAYFGE